MSGIGDLDVRAWADVAALLKARQVRAAGAAALTTTRGTGWCTFPLEMGLRWWGVYSCGLMPEGWALTDPEHRALLLNPVTYAVFRNGQMVTRMRELQAKRPGLHRLDTDALLDAGLTDLLRQETLG